MTQAITSARSGDTSNAPTRSPERIRGLVVCGILAGPLFIVVASSQALTRDGFDLGRHAISALSLGDLGWIQRANSLVAGFLMVAFAVGARRVLVVGHGATWAPRLLGAFGVGLIVAGIFVTDPALGFPPGTPNAMPDELSWHAVVHSIGFILAFVSLTAACVVFARRCAALRQQAWAVYSVATAVVALALSMWPGRDGAGIRFFVASVIGFAWTTVVAVRLRSETQIVGSGSASERARLSSSPAG
jgi:hypothetical membrane protein